MQLRKLVIVNLLIIVTALAIIGGLVFSTINTTIKDQFVHSNEIVLENGVDLIEGFIKRNKDTVLDIAIDPIVQEYLDAFNGGNSKISNINNYIDDHWAYDYQIKSVAGFLEIYPYRHNDVYAYNTNVNSYTAIPKEDWMDEVIRSNGAFIVKTTEIDGVSFIRIAMLSSSIENYPESFCLLSLYIRTDILLSSFYSTKLENSSIPYLINENSQIILPYEDIYNLTKEDIEYQDSGWWLKDENIIINAPMVELNWKLIGVLPENDLMEKSNDIKNTFFIVGGFSVMFLILVSIGFSIWITRPITNLSKEMARVEKNDFREIAIDKSFGVETTHLYKQFNYMVRRVNSLIDEVYMAQIKEKEAELLALQQQINPHFLYNTLDSIAWMSMKYKAEDIRYMVMSLASMMRYSLNEGNNYISVRNELEQVRNYVGIQEIRYDHKFSTNIKSKVEAMNYSIIKLIIQPLVENAIVHGFKETGKFGNIDINVDIVDNNLIIQVINDGGEIDLEKVKRLLDPEDSFKSKHYGLKNVNDRLIKSFGKGSGIVFSVENNRTIAKIIIAVELLDEGDDDE